MNKLIEPRSEIINSSIHGTFIDIVKAIPSIHSDSKYVDISRIVSDSFSRFDTSIPFVAGLNDAAILVSKAFGEINIGIKYGDSDVSLLDDLQVMQATTLMSVSGDYKRKVTNLIYASRESGVDTSLLEQLFVSGVADGMGNSLQQVIGTISETMTMNAYSTLMLKKGDEAGITRYKYIGSLIVDSRKWCVDHVNRVYTRDQIKGWGRSIWAGKNPGGDPFITRGGYRCRHHFAPVA